MGVDYDPLLAKLVIFGEDRDAAIARARRALEDWTILGVETNLPLLAAVLESKEFLSGHYATDLVERLRPRAPAEPPDAAWIAAALAFEEGAGSGPPGGAAAGLPPEPWDQMRGWRAGG